MRRKKRSFLLLIISLLSFGALFYLVFSYNPYASISIPNVNFQLSTQLAFFLLLFLSSSSLLGYLTNNTRRGLLIGCCITAILLLRFFGLKNILFIVLVIAITITIELFFSQKE